MSISAELEASPTAAALPHRRRGQWLFWLAFALVTVSGWRLAAFCLAASFRNHHPLSASDVAHLAVPLCAGEIALILAGIVLLCWRNAQGLIAALVLIWLGAVLPIEGDLLRHAALFTSGANLNVTGLPFLRGGLFHAAGYTAFLLGVPAVRRAYGLTRGKPSQASGNGDIRRHTAGWLAVLGFFLMLPVLLLISTIGRDVMETDSFWSTRPDDWRLVCLTFAVPSLLAVLCLVLLRRRFAIRLTVAVLWLIPIATHLLMPLILLHSWQPGWRFIETLPDNFGFDLLAAVSWTAYLLNAPRAQEMYPVPIKKIDVEVL